MMRRLLEGVNDETGKSAEMTNKEITEMLKSMMKKGLLGGLDMESEKVHHSSIDTQRPQRPPHGHLTPDRSIATLLPVLVVHHTPTYR